MSTANRLHIIDIQWPDWKNYILMPKISESELKHIEIKLNKEQLLSNNELSIYVYQELFKDKIINVLKKIGYLTDNQDPDCLSPDERYELIEKIDILITNNWNSDLRKLNDKYDNKIITLQKYKNLLPDTKTTIDTLDFLAAETIWFMCSTFGLIIDINEDLQQKQTHKGITYHFIGLSNAINECYYRFITKFNQTKGGVYRCNNKRKIITKIEHIIKKYKLKNPANDKTNTSQLISEIKKLYKQEYNKALTLKDKTIEKHIYDYFIKPKDAKQKKILAS